MPDFQITKLSDEKICSMQITELGIYVLNFIDKADVGWNISGTLGELAYQTLPNGEKIRRDPPIQQIIAETIHWLLNSGLLSRNRPPALGSGHTADSMFITRDGKKVLEDAEMGLRIVTANKLLRDVHSELAAIHSRLIEGDYRDAVFASLRTVEARVRNLISPQGDDKIGVPLMNYAFGTNGPLTDSIQPGRSDGVRSLFAGAFGVYRNDTAHTLNEEEYRDPVEIAEIILLTDLLHRHLDRVEQRLNTPSTDT